MAEISVGVGRTARERERCPDTGRPPAPRPTTPLPALGRRRSAARRGQVDAITGYIGADGEQREFTEGVATFARRYAKVTRKDMKARSRATDS